MQGIQIDIGTGYLPAGGKDNGGVAFPRAIGMDRMAIDRGEPAGRRKGFCVKTLCRLLADNADSQEKQQA